MHRDNKFMQNFTPKESTDQGVDRPSGVVHIIQELSFCFRMKDDRLFLNARISYSTKPVFIK
jgi:hypothetical protein